MKVLYDLYKDDKRIGSYRRRELLGIVGIDEKEFRRYLKSGEAINGYTFYAVEGENLKNCQSMKKYGAELLVEWDRTVKELLPKVKGTNIRITAPETEFRL